MGYDGKTPIVVNVGVQQAVFDAYKAETTSGVANIKTGFGAVGDGVTDDTTPILDADATTKRVVYPQGRYLFTGSDNPTFTGGVDLINSHIDGEHYQDILALNDDSKTLVGLHHNHKQITDIINPITNGVIVAPPMSKAFIPFVVDIIAHWYQDNGLEFTRAGGGGATWYTWEWNHVGSVGYDPKRHPLLGWYRGDDANVLDWQCYWLREYGIGTVCLNPSSELSTTTWGTATDGYHWLYQLFNNVKNFNGLRYILWGSYTGTALAILAQWEYIIDNIYLVYRNFKTIEMDGKIYPVMYCFEGGTLFTALGNTDVAFNAFVETLANKFKAVGYGGIALFVRHPKSLTSLNRKPMEDLGCLYFSADYGGHGGFTTQRTVSDELTYSAMVDSYLPYHQTPEWASGTVYALGDLCRRNGILFGCSVAHTASATTTPWEGKTYYTVWTVMDYTKRVVQCIANSKYAIAPHPTAGNAYWKAAGSTPALFEKWLRKAIDYSFLEGSPRMIMVYNVSEWAEGGPGLQPNVTDGFGYLQAVKNALSGYTEVQRQFPNGLSTETNFVTATSAIIPRADIIRLTTDFGRTLTSTPTIQQGKDGQRIRIMNINVSYTITLQDNATLAGSNLFLSATTIVLGPFDSIELEYVTGKGWVQVGQVNVL